MSRYSGAIWRDVGAPGNYSNGRMRSYLGVVLHVNDADSGDLFGWITGGASDMSCHFQVLKDGTVYQYIDTAFSSWCQANGNDDYLSVETQGFPNEALTAAQVKAVAGIMRFAHDAHGIPLVVTDVVGSRGLIAHGDGGAAWGGHTACPGDLRRNQRPAILSLASGQSALTETAVEIVTPAEIEAVAQRVRVLLIADLKRGGVLGDVGTAITRINAHTDLAAKAKPAPTVTTTVALDEAALTRVVKAALSGATIKAAS